MKKNQIALFLFFLFSITLFRIYFVGTFNLSYDEAYNVDWSRRLALDYYSEPGLIAWVTAFFITVFGESETGVRLGAVIFSIVSSLLLLWLAVLVTKNIKVACLSILGLQLSPLGSIGAILLIFLFLSFKSKVEANWTNIGFPATFILIFIYFFEVRWEELVGKDGLFVNNGEPTESAKSVFVKAFKSFRLIKEIPVYRKEYKEPIRVMKIYYCKNFLGVDKLKKPMYY
ncbi:MAG: hypothetical protein AB1633_06110 [Elusimicrobiota bacterium]